MTGIDRLSVQVGAALVIFSIFFLLAPPAAQAQQRPEWKGKEKASNIHALINQNDMGGGIVILVKPDGAIEARVVNPQGGPTAIRLWQMDETGDKIWYNEDGKPEDPPMPPASGPGLKGAGDITKISIYQGNTCGQINLNGRWVTVCNP
jgi:hypothetical protein